MNNIITIEKLVKKFGEKTILNNVDFSIEIGEVYVILGPSGCGKSTFLRCINGLEEIESGNIVFNGQELSNKKTQWEEVRQKIGMVFQNYELFPNQTVIENIELGPVKVQKRDKEEVRKQAVELLEKIGLSDRKNDYPRQLSGGQKQRVAIVRALCMNPEVMLFDEVTASLDPEMVREVLEVILNLAKQGMTMIIVTHEMNFAKNVADKIAFMNDGEIVELTTPEIFFKNPSTERAKKFLTSFDY